MWEIILKGGGGGNASLQTSITLIAFFLVRKLETSLL